jgi:hypothetical protein
LAAHALTRTNKIPSVGRSGSDRLTTPRRPQTAAISVLVPVSSVLGVTAQVDRPSAEPVISEATVIQLVRKTARIKKVESRSKVAEYWVEQERTA